MGLLKLDENLSFIHCNHSCIANKLADFNAFLRFWTQQDQKFSRAKHTDITKPPHFKNCIYTLGAVALSMARLSGQMPDYELVRTLESMRFNTTSVISHLEIFVKINTFMIPIPLLGQQSCDVVQLQEHSTIFFVIKHMRLSPQEENLC